MKILVPVKRVPAWEALDTPLCMSSGSGPNVWLRARCGDATRTEAVNSTSPKMAFRGPPRALLQSAHAPDRAGGAPPAHPATHSHSDGPGQKGGAVDVVLKGRGIRITDQMRRTIEHKIGKIERLDSRVSRVEVEVFEAAPTVGGGTRTEELTLPGFRHDVCSAIHPLACASPAFRELGLELDFVHSPAACAHPFDGAL